MKKEKQKNPGVSMGVFLDKNGEPLAEAFAYDNSYEPVVLRFARRENDNISLETVTRLQRWLAALHAVAQLQK